MTTETHYCYCLSPTPLIMNIGDTYTTGPQEAAYVVNERVQLTTVIASPANEAATKSGKVIFGTRSDSFIKASLTFHII